MPSQGQDVRLRMVVPPPIEYFNLRADAVAYWKLDEASGTRVDATGNGRDLTQHNGVVGVSGKVSNAARLDSALNRYLDIPNTPFETGNIDFTWSCWFKFRSFPTIESGENGDLITKGVPDGSVDEYSLFYVTAISAFRFYSYDQGNFDSVDSSVTIQLNTWYHAIFGYDKTAGKVFLSVNETLDTVDITATPNVVSGGNLFIGGDVILLGAAVGNVADADMDEIGFWKRLLTADEKAYLYNSGAGRTLFP